MLLQGRLWAWSWGDQPEKSALGQTPNGYQWGEAGCASLFRQSSDVDPGSPLGVVTTATIAC